MFQNHPLQQLAHGLLLVFCELAHSLELQRQILAGTALVFVEHQVIEAHVQHFGQPDRASKVGCAVPAEALAYLQARGLDHPELVERFRLGYANRTLGLRLPDKTRKAGFDIRARLDKIGIYRESGTNTSTAVSWCPSWTGRARSARSTAARSRMACARARRCTCTCPVRTTAFGARGMAYKA
jgi:hypothetical protein